MSRMQINSDGPLRSTEQPFVLPAPREFSSERLTAGEVSQTFNTVAAQTGQSSQGTTSGVSIQSLEQQLASLFARYGDQLVRHLNLNRGAENHPDSIRMLGELRTVLGLQPNTPLSLLNFSTGSVMVRNGSGVGRITGDSGFVILSGDRELLSGGIHYNGTERVNVSVAPRSALTNRERPEWLTPLLAPVSAEQGRQEALERREHSRLIELLLPDAAQSRRPELAADPGLRHLTAVFQQLRTLASGGPSEARNSLRFLTHSENPSEARLAETAAWVSRMLVSNSLTPSSENITQSLSTLVDAQRSARHVPLFHNRAIVVAAGAEMVADVGGFTAPQLASVTARHGDYYRFGSVRMIETLRESGATSVTMHRARPDVGTQMDAVLRSHSAHLSALRAEQPTAEQNSQISALTRDVRNVLGISANERIRLTHTVSVNGQSGRFRVFVGNGTEPVYDASVDIANGQVQALTYDNEYATPPSHRSITSAQVRDQVLEAIRTTPPGENGFCFIFNGHGLPNAIALDGNHTGGRAIITPAQLADAIIARRQRFGDRTNNDVYMMLTCFGDDFIQDVRRRIQPSGAAPYLYASTEHGQHAYERLGTDIASPDFLAITQRNIRIRQERSERDGPNGAPRPGVMSIGDLMELMMQRRESVAPNPTLYFPLRLQNQEQRRFYQISGELAGERRST